MDVSNQQKKILFILGPTAVGKTDLAFKLAQELGGEIVSCDAMQVYRELNIATSKPPGDFLTVVPHYLIDIVSVEQSFNVAAFNTLACQCVQAIHQRNRLPIIVGGSGLYAQILLDGIFEDSPDEGLRQALRREAQEKGGEVLHARLRQLDGGLAENIHPHDIKRLVRALEVCISKVEPMSACQRKRKGLWGQFDIHAFVLNRERQALYRRIEARVDAMFRQGLVDEIRSLSGLSLSRTARSIIGLREIQGFLEGEYSEAHAGALIKLNTRRLAKRQLTWFRRDTRFQWVMLEDRHAAASDGMGRIKQTMID